MTNVREKHIQERANESYRWFAERVGKQLRVRTQAQAHNHWDWVEAITTDMLEDPLCLDVDTVDPSGDEVKWNLLLGTGGPAVRILVTTDLNGSIEDADYQFQDWFQPWTSAEGQNRDLVREYAETFYYGRIAVTLDGMEIP